MSRPTTNRSGLPVKAVPKRIFTAGGKPKVKTPNLKTFIMPPNTKPDAYPPTGKLLAERLSKVAELERNQSNNSDPFLFNRMRAQVRAGIETFE